MQEDLHPEEEEGQLEIDRGTVREGKAIKMTLGSHEKEEN